MPNKFVPYWRSPVGRIRTSPLVVVVKDLDNHKLDYKLPAHIVQKLRKQGWLRWDHENKCYIEVGPIPSHVVCSN